MKCYYCGKKLKKGEYVVELELLKLFQTYDVAYNAKILGEAFFHLECFKKAKLESVILTWRVKGTKDDTVEMRTR